MLAAEAEARDRKRKAEGKPPLAVDNGSGADAATEGQTEESNKRRKLLQEALELDKDDDDEDEKSEKGENGDEDEDDECVSFLSTSLVWAVRCDETDVELPGTRMRTRRRTTRQNSCASWRRLSGSEQRRRSGRTGSSLRPRRRSATRRSPRRTRC